MAPIRFERAEDEDRAPRVSFIPLIDIVLQIICFYLFISAGVQMYQDSSVQLPEMRSDLLAGESPAELTINIDADGALNVNGAPLDNTALPATLSGAREKAAGENKPLMVAIRADKRQQYGALDTVLQACRDAKVPTISIRAISPTVGGGGGR